MKFLVPCSVRAVLNKSPEPSPGPRAEKALSHCFLDEQVNEGLGASEVRAAGAWGPGREAPLTRWPLQTVQPALESHCLPRSSPKGGFRAAPRGGFGVTSASSSLSSSPCRKEQLESAARYVSDYEFLFPTTVLGARVQFRSVQGPGRPCQSHVEFWDHSSPCPPHGNPLKATLVVTIATTAP